MALDDQEIKHSTAAYRVFVSELGKHLAAVQSVAESEGVELEILDVSDASERCHKIKGGAGFFGLDQIAAVASKLEAAMLKPLADVQKDIEAIKDLVQELEQHMGDLPAPREKE